MENNLQQRDEQYSNAAGLRSNTGPGQETPKSGTARRGFASMNKDKQREIASKGGKAAHRSGNAHQWTSEEARAAGRKGGQASGNSQSRPQPNI